jgi:hypothetical protein
VAAFTLVYFYGIGVRKSGQAFSENVNFDHVIDWNFTGLWQNCCGHSGNHDSVSVMSR